MHVNKFLYVYKYTYCKGKVVDVHVVCSKRIKSLRIAAVSYRHLIANQLHVKAVGCFFYLSIPPHLLQR